MLNIKKFLRDNIFLRQKVFYKEISRIDNKIDFFLKNEFNIRDNFKYKEKYNKLLQLYDETLLSLYSSNEIVYNWINNLNDMKKIPIETAHHVVFVSDRNYFFQTAVAMSSLLRHRYKNTRYVIHLLTNSNINNSHSIFNVFNSCLEIHDNINIPNNLQVEHEYISDASLIKFLIPDQINNTDKALYLDSDTIVLSDLSELFNIDISKYYAAVCSDLYLLSQHMNLKIHSDNYFNAGVMLLNIKKMSCDNVKEKLINYYSNPTFLLKFGDQDALNYILKNNIIYINPKYNFLASNKMFFDDNTASQILGLTNNEYNMIASAPSILHFAGIKDMSSPENIFGYYRYRIEEIIFNKIIEKNIQD